MYTCKLLIAFCLLTIFSSHVLSQLSSSLVTDGTCATRGGDDLTPEKLIYLFLKQHGN